MGTVKVEGHSQTQWIKKMSQVDLKLFFRFDSKVSAITTTQKLCRLCPTSVSYIIPEELHTLQGNAL